MNQQFLQYFGLRKNPFHVSPDPRCFYSTSASDGALGQLVFGIESRQGVMVLTGGPGTGKTTILHYLLEWLRQQGYSTSYVFHSQVSSAELLELIVHDFGISCPSHAKCDLLKALHNWLLSRYRAGDCPVILIDEAQALSHEALDELRMLLNLEVPGGKLVQVVLAGQPKLNKKLRHRDLLQLRQRVVFHCKLPRLTREETSGYINARLATAGISNLALFPGESIEEIFRYSRGTPRVINLLCEHGLLAAYSGQRDSISPADIHRIARQFDFGERIEPSADSPAAESFGGLAAFPQLELLAEPAPLPAREPSWLEALAPADLALPALPQPNVRTVRRRISRPTPPFLLYLRGVQGSFAKDCQELVRPVKTWLKGPLRAIARNSQATGQSAIAAVSNWLRQPTRSGGMVAQRPRASSVAPKHF
jgi:type II secretory pathway predicted ATPase ExeA